MKRTILVLLTLIMLLSFTACSSSETEESSADESTETTEVSSESSSANGFEAFQDEANSLAESSDANVEESSESEDDGKVSTVNNDYDTVYLQWKYSNWESASDEDRRKCAIAYLGYYGDVLGWKVTEDDQTDEQLEKIETSLEGALENNQDFTVQEIILYILSEDSSSSESSEG
jgi:hypothetical protein